MQTTLAEGREKVASLSPWRIGPRVLSCLLLCGLACKTSEGTTGANASAPSASLLASATSVAPPASASAVPSGWPRVMPLPNAPPSSATGGGAASEEHLEETDASIAMMDAMMDASTEGADALLAPLNDSTVDAPDAHKQDAKSDVGDDAPLLGTKTFLDETPMRGIRKVTANAAKVHKAPKDGLAIATLPKGTEVALVAELYDWVRVRYTDPATNVRRQGWVYEVNFAGPRQKSCPEGWRWHAQDGGWCDRDCNRNTDCRALKGYKCSGRLCFYAGD